MNKQRRANRESAAVIGNAGLPPSRVLYRYLWPFWLFQNASRGDLFFRAAAYRHNRDMRVHLPAYMMRWSLGSAVLLLPSLATQAFSASTPSPGGYMMWMVVGSEIAFSCAICILLMLTYIYVYLSSHER